MESLWRGAAGSDRPCHVRSCWNLYSQDDSQKRPRWVKLKVSHGWLLAPALRKVLQKARQRRLIFPCIVSLPWFTVEPRPCSSAPSCGFIRGEGSGARGVPQPPRQRNQTFCSKKPKPSALWEAEQPPQFVLEFTEQLLGLSFCLSVCMIFFPMGETVVTPPRSFRKDKYYSTVGKAKQRVCDLKGSESWLSWKKLSPGQSSGPKCFLIFIEPVYLAPIRF